MLKIIEMISELIKAVNGLNDKGNYDKSSHENSPQFPILLSSFFFQRTLFLMRGSRKFFQKGSIFDVFFSLVFFLLMMKGGRIQIPL